MTILKTYHKHLETVGKSSHTIKAYSHDVAAFALWFEQTNGEDFDPQAIDPRDIRDYKGYLMTRGRAPATINRRLIALCRFFHRAKQGGSLPTALLKL